MTERFLELKKLLEKSEIASVSRSVSQMAKSVSRVSRGVCPESVSQACPGVSHTCPTRDTLKTVIPVSRARVLETRSERDTNAFFLFFDGLILEATCG